MVAVETKGPSIVVVGEDGLKWRRFVGGDPAAPAVIENHGLLVAAGIGERSEELSAFALESGEIIWFRRAYDRRFQLADSLASSDAVAVVSVAGHEPVNLEMAGHTLQVVWKGGERILEVWSPVAGEVVGWRAVPLWDVKGICLYGDVPKVLLAGDVESGGMLAEYSLLDLAKEGTVQPVGLPVWKLAATSDGAFVGFVDQGFDSLYLAGPRSLTSRRRLECNHGIADFCFLGNSLVTVLRNDGVADIFDLSTLDLVFSFAAVDSEPLCVSSNASGKVMLSADASGGAKLWQVAN